MEALLKRRDLLIQHMERSSLPEESYLKYVKTINDTFHSLRRTIDPCFSNGKEYEHPRQEVSKLQGTVVHIESDAHSYGYVLQLHLVASSFTPHNRLFLSIGTCSSQNHQYKTNMEDTMKLIDCFGTNDPHTHRHFFHALAHAIFS